MLNYFMYDISTCSEFSISFSKGPDMTQPYSTLILVFEAQFGRLVCSSRPSEWLLLAAQNPSVSILLNLL